MNEEIGMDEYHPLYKAIDKGGGQTCNVSGVIRALNAAGYVIVPREPTDDICRALAAHYHDNWRNGHEREDTDCEDVWRDGINAALDKINAQRS